MMDEFKKRAVKQALNSDGPVKLHGVTLDAGTIEIAKEVGEGKISRGIRRLARFYMAHKEAEAQ